MGRPPKYLTEEERQEARRRARRKYYASHAEQERLSALKRWHSRKDTQKQRRRQRHGELDPLPCTTSLLGSPAKIQDSTPLQAAAAALRADLARWKAHDVDDDAAWTEYTTRLLKTMLNSKKQAKVHLELRKKANLAQQVLDIAQAGWHEAWRRRIKSEESELDELAQRAHDIAHGLRELLTLHEAGESLLQEMYDSEKLAWQCI